MIEGRARGKNGSNFVRRVGHSTFPSVTSLHFLLCSLLGKQNSRLISILPQTSPFVLGRHYICCGLYARLKCNMPDTEEIYSEVKIANLPQKGWIHCKKKVGGWKHSFCGTEVFCNNFNIWPITQNATRFREFAEKTETLALQSVWV